MRCLLVISEQTDFSLCDAGQAIGKPAARLWRTGVVMLIPPPLGLVWLTGIMFLNLGIVVVIFNLLLGAGRPGAPSGLSPRPSCSIAFLAFSSRVGSPGGGARDQESKLCMKSIVNCYTVVRRLILLLTLISFYLYKCCYV